MKIFCERKNWLCVYIYIYIYDGNRPKRSLLSISYSHKYYIEIENIVLRLVNIIIEAIMLIRKSKTNQVINSEWALEFLAPTNNLGHVAQN